MTADTLHVYIYAGWRLDTIISVSSDVILKDTPVLASVQLIWYPRIMPLCVSSGGGSHPKKMLVELIA